VSDADTLAAVPLRLPYQLGEFFRSHSDSGQSLALITVLHTEGSTYSKAGSQMLVNEGGDFQGMLSGGCLEGDLAERSKAIIASGIAQTVTYDLRADDEIFGFGVGCEGALNIYIQPLSAAAAYEPFSSLIRTLENAPVAEMKLSETDAELGIARIRAPIRLLVLGAGQDAEPLVTFGVTLGWEVFVSDHRPAAAARLTDSGAASIQCVPADELAAHIDLGRFDAVIVMSHNLNVDTTYLRALADTTIDFIGLLGPPHRRDKIFRELGGDANNLSDRIRGPVGRQIGGRGPAAIALEIAAELQAHFS
jgi:xanthine dehydrogenase accessory factor